MAETHPAWKCVLENKYSFLTLALASEILAIGFSMNKKGRHENTHPTPAN
jgi:hypothetical protein